MAHGVRAQLRTGNLLTGALYVALDFFPGAPPATVDWSQKPVQLPTVPGQLEATEATVEEIIKKIDRMPLTADRRQRSQSHRRPRSDAWSAARGTLVSARGTLDNTNNLTGPNSLQVQQLDNTLQEVEPRGPVGARARRLSRAPSRGAPARQERGGEVMDRYIAYVIAIALAAAVAGCGTSAPCAILHAGPHRDFATAHRCTHP